MATLPDDVLLDIFDFYRNDFDHTRRAVWKWHVLVHVCRRWRQIIFESPRRLDLNIYCTCKTPVRKSLGIWPAFPIAVDCLFSSFDDRPGDEDNVLAALEYANRVRYLKFDLRLSALRNLVTVTQKPFPVLTHLVILSKPDIETLVLPAEFLGGFAPRLQRVFLRNVAIPALPTLLATASDLVELQLRRIRRAGHISPTAMALCLAQLPRLKVLVIRFQYPIFTPGHTHPPIITQIVLPALTDFEFTGANEYLEELVSLIDGPRLNRIVISYLRPVVDFQVVQLCKFFDRSVDPARSPFKHAKVRLDTHGVTFDMYHPPNHTGTLPARTIISCREIDWRVFHMDQVLRKFATMLSNIIDLKLVGWFHKRRLFLADLEWVHVLHQFSTVQALYVSREFAQCITRELKSMTEEMVAKALFSTELICLEDQPTSDIMTLVAVRQHSGRPVTVVSTEAEFDRILESK